MPELSAAPVAIQLLLPRCCGPAGGMAAGCAAARPELIAGDLYQARHVRLHAPPPKGVSDVSVGHTRAACPSARAVRPRGGREDRPSEPQAAHYRVVQGAPRLCRPSVQCVGQAAQGHAPTCPPSQPDLQGALLALAAPPCAIQARSRPVLCRSSASNILQDEEILRLCSSGDVC